MKHPSDEQTQFIIGLFQKGRTLAYVKAATSSAWSDAIYQKLHDLALRGRP